MTENGAKNEDYLVDKHPRNNDSCSKSSGEILNIQLDNLASGSTEITSPQASSFVQQCSPQEAEKCYNKKKDSTTGAGFSKKTSGLRHTKDNLKEKEESIHNKVPDDSCEIPRKTKDERDTRNFRSMTIDRMGKMLKLKSSNFERNEFELTSQEVETRKVSYPSEKPSPKEKTNSLGRMLKLMDKDVGPRRIFGQSKSESANRFSKADISLDKEKKTAKPSDDRIRRAFSKMLSQIRGRAGNTDTSAEPNFRASDGKSKVSLPPRPPIVSKIIDNLSSSRSSLSPTKNSPLPPDPTSSTSENFAYPV